MSGNKTYIGRHFKFKIGEKIGKGGNGAVYNVIMDEDSSNQYVVKFFEYTVDKGHSAEKAQERYVRLLESGGINHPESLRISQF